MGPGARPEGEPIGDHLPVEERSDPCAAEEDRRTARTEHLPFGCGFHHNRTLLLHTITPIVYITDPRASCQGIHRKMLTLFMDSNTIQVSDNKIFAISGSSKCMYKLDISCGCSYRGQCFIIYSSNNLLSE